LCSAWPRFGAAGWSARGNFAAQQHPPRKAKYCPDIMVL
jgi:hypothetical protein